MTSNTTTDRETERAEESAEARTEEQAACLAALAYFGRATRVDLLCEESGELAEAIGHYKRGRCGVDAVAEEAADVRIVLGQLAEAYGAREIANARAAFRDGERRECLGDPFDWARECCARVQAELMLARRCPSPPLLASLAIARAMNAIAELVEYAGAQELYAAARRRKVARLWGRMAASLAELATKARG